MMKDNYMPQVYLLEAIRQFFSSKGFHDVLTPPMVSNPGMEVHIHPFQVAQAKDQQLTNSYLHTSPEFWMKRLLSEGLEKIFTLSYCFRNEPNSDWHRSQFIMLEWYRSEEFYTSIMQDCFNLYVHCHQHLEQKGIEVVELPAQFQMQKMTVQEIFNKYLNFDILEFLDAVKLREHIRQNFKDVPLPEEKCEWDDYFFLLFLNKIEPELTKYPFLVLYNYPAPLAALSTLNKEDPRVCDRFELYCNGIELANCFNELVDLEQQIHRFEEQAIQKKQLYQYQLPKPEMLYKSLQKGLPTSSGIALGVERLLSLLTNKKYHFWDE